MNGRPWIIVVLAGALGLGAGALVRHWLAPAPPDPTPAAPEPSTDTTGEAPAIVGRDGPGFDLPDRAGEQRTLGEFEGQVVLLNFWASWCPPCIEEIPALDALQREVGDDGLQVVGIALEDAGAMKAFAADRGIGYPLLVGDRGAFDLVARYGNERGTLPYSVVIDRSGTVRATHQGALDRDEAEALVAPWL